MRRLPEFLLLSFFVFSFFSLSDFHRTYAEDEWTKERASWRAVIYLNLVQGVNDVLEHLIAEMTESIELQGPQIKTDEGRPTWEFEDKYRRLRIRLAPLNRVEMELERILGAVKGERKLIPNSTGDAASDTETLHSMIDSSDTWKSALFGASEKVEGNITEKIIDSCADIGSLWNDSKIKEVLSRRKARVLETNARLCVPQYHPEIFILTSYQLLRQCRTDSRQGLYANRRRYNPCTIEDVRHTRI